MTVSLVNNYDTKLIWITLFQTY